MSAPAYLLVAVNVLFGAFVLFFMYRFIVFSYWYVKAQKRLGDPPSSDSSRTSFERFGHLAISDVEAIRQYSVYKADRILKNINNPMQRHMPADEKGHWLAEIDYLRNIHDQVDTVLAERVRKLVPDGF